MKKKILVVDDVLGVRILLDNILSKTYDVVTACNGVEALLHLKSGNQTDLILTDLDMPLMTGEDLIESLNLYFKQFNVPIIILSGEEEKELKKLSGKKNVFAVLSKPCNFKDLTSKVKQALSRV